MLQMKTYQHSLIVGIFCVILILLTAYLASCSSRGVSSFEEFPKKAELGKASISLEALTAELYRLNAPEGIDNALLSNLKRNLVSELSKVIADKGRIALKPPSGAMSVVDDISVFTETSGWQFTWSYRNQGDGNEDGRVDIQDILPLATYFFKTSSSDREAEVADYNGDGIVNIQEVSSLAQNFFAELANYRLEFSYDGGVSWEAVAIIPFSERQIITGRDTYVKSYLQTQEDPLPDLARVVPMDSASNAGVPSFPVNLPSPFRSPNIPSVTPTQGITGEEVTFTPVVSGTRPINFTWDFGNAGTPNTSTEETPTIILSSPNTYRVTVIASNSFGSDSFQFDLRVLPLGEPPVINSVTPTSGVEQTQVQFTVDATGTQPITYSWDFGGGATPNIIETQETTVDVLLTTPGVHQAQVTATNSVGSTTYIFTLTVNPWMVPPQIISITPTDATRGITVTFMAQVNGTPPFTFLWNFGDAGNPSTSTAENPRVRLSSPSTYTISLEVSNSAGTDSKNFDITISPPETVSPWASINFQIVASGLQKPTYIIHSRDGSGRLFVLEQRGTIRLIKDGILLPTPFLNITDRVGSAGSEQGLLGLAFHPEYSINGKFFVNYTDLLGDTVVSEFLVSGNKDRADPD